MADLHLLIPGSPEARERGCVCEAQEPRITDGPRGEDVPAYRCEPGCPIHGLAVAHALFHRR
jgi:hypothetical protein